MIDIKALGANARQDLERERRERHLRNGAAVAEAACRTVAVMLGIPPETVRVTTVPVDGSGVALPLGEAPKGSGATFDFNGHRFRLVMRGGMVRSGEDEQGEAVAIEVHDYDTDGIDPEELEEGGYLEYGV